MMDAVLDALPDSMLEELMRAVDVLKTSSRILAVSHIDSDGIAALAIIVQALQRAGKAHSWHNIHQLNSETIITVRELVREKKPDVVVFSDFGTGQMHLIQQFIANEDGVNCVIVLDHHLPDNGELTGPRTKSDSIIEINPWLHNMSGSYELSGAGTAFLMAYGLSRENLDLTEMAIVGASGDLQDYYGKGFTGLNKVIVEAGEKGGFIEVEKDLRFFGINTRPLPYLLQYATDPYLPGLTGNGDACLAFFNEIGIPLKDSDDTWRMWVDLTSEEKSQVVQHLIGIILDSYEDSRVASGIIGDVITLAHRPPRTVLRSAKEFSTLLNACGRNRKPEIGVEICLGNKVAYREGMVLLKQHRSNLATALHRLETQGYREMPGMYVVDDPETPDTIIGIVIGMAQGSRMVPIDKPVIGIATNRSVEGPTIKISGRAHKSIVDLGVNLRDVFVDVSDKLNSGNSELVAEAGGHPMAAGAFVHEDFLLEFLERISERIDQIFAYKNG
ncbi:MAG: DHH family phosphoesterase [Candidatus Thorarchaeota archaeon]|nr:MAG: DHH family phosphoesterase [Candidatus Thorarchaeota archaeon]